LLFTVLGPTVSESIVTEIAERDCARAEQFRLLLAENDLLPAFVQKRSCGVVGSGFFKVPFAVRSSPPYPPNTAALDTLRNALHFTIPQGEIAGTGL
jgi:hypothetical protein